MYFDTPTRTILTRTTTTAATTTLKFIEKQEEIANKFLTKQTTLLSILMYIIKRNYIAI